MILIKKNYGVALLLVLSALISQSGRAESTLNFPRLSSQAGTITGVTFVNPNNQDAQVTVTAYTSAGTMPQGAQIQNPRVLVVPANGQTGLVVPELFGSGLNPATVGWFQATSPADNITGFFLFLNEHLTQFDGADLPPLERKIIFNQIRLGAGFSTELNIINPASLSTGLDVLLVDGEDIFQPNPETIDATLAAKGSLRIDVATFFGVNAVSEGAYVLVISDTQVGGFEFVRSPSGDLLGLNARGVIEQLNTLYFPQLAVLGPLRMELGVVNYSPRETVLIITAFQPDGTPYGAPDVARNSVTRTLGPGLALREDVETLFGFIGNNALEGWIKVEATEEAVNGYVTYGVPAAGSVAAVAALSRASERAIFSHIATTLGFFTGVAALNPSSAAADLRVVAVTRAGQVLGVYDQVLEPGQRISRLITELIPEAEGQAGGLIWMRSNRPLYLTSLFGTNSGTVFSNVPPQPAPLSYQPDQGVPQPRVMPELTVLPTGGSTTFQAQGLVGNFSWLVNGVPGGNSSIGTISAAGQYQAPAIQPGSLPIVITAHESEERSAAATLDLLSSETVAAGLQGIQAMAYLDDTDRLYVSQLIGGDSRISRVTRTSTQEIITYRGEEMASMIPFRAFSGQQFLLLGSRNLERIVRLNPETGASRTVISGFGQIQALSWDPVTGELLVADDSGVSALSGVQVESDLVSGLTENGTDVITLFGRSNVAGLAVDECSGDVYFTDSGTGEVLLYDAQSFEITQVAAGLNGAGTILRLYRRDVGCSQALYLLVAERGAQQVRLVVPGKGLVSPWVSSNAVALAFQPSDGSFAAEQGVLIAESAAAGALGTRVVLVQTPGLFSTMAVNPLDAVPVGRLAEPVGDVFSDVPVVHDIVELAADFNENSLRLTVTFSDTISPCIQSDNPNDPNDDFDPCTADGNPFDAVSGFIDIDTDQNPATGFAASTDFNSPYASGLGVDFCIDLGTYDPDAGGVAAFLFEDGETFFVGRFPVDFTSHAFSVVIPLDRLEDDGLVNVAAVFGVPSDPTDAAPNGGFVTSAPLFGGDFAVALDTVRRTAEGALKVKIDAAPRNNIGGWKRGFINSVRP